MSGLGPGSDGREWLGGNAGLRGSVVVVFGFSGNPGGGWVEKRERGGELKIGGARGLSGLGGVGGAGGEMA